MSLTIRRVAASESWDYVRTMFWAAGRPVEDTFVKERLVTFELDRALAAFDGPKLVGTVGTRTLTMSLPGGRRVAMAGMGQGGVLPSHQGRGIMRALMMQAQRDAMDRGDILAAGTTSEWPLYERYGWGPATYCASYSIRNLARSQARRLPEPRGLCELVEPSELLPDMVDLHRRATTAPGGVERDHDYWRHVFGRLERGASLDVLDTDAAGPPALFCRTKGASGSVEAGAAFRVHQRWRNGLFDSEMAVDMLVAATREALERLWHFLLGTAAVERLSIGHRPIDDPLRFMLKDGRRLETAGLQDHIWMRVLDPARALESRRMGPIEPPLRLRIEDPLAEIRNDTLEIASDGIMTEVKATTKEPDIQMGLAAFSSLFLGGNSVWSLLAADRLVATSEASLLCLARGLSSDHAPFTDTSF